MVYDRAAARPRHDIGSDGYASSSIARVVLMHLMPLHQFIKGKCALPMDYS